MKFEVSSNLSITPEEVKGLLTMQGVNWELSPFIRMTAPPEWSEKPIFEWPTYEELFSSWILLFSFLPIDRHKFFFKRIDDQQGFAEASSSTTNKRWLHHREFVRNGDLCRVIDTIEFQCRLPMLGYVLAPLYHFIFKHRHRVLRLQYGGR